MVQSSLFATLKQLLWDILSFLLSIPDILMPYCNSVPSAPKFFTRGHGNPNIYNTRLHKTLAGLLDGSYLDQYKLEQGKNLTVMETRRRNGVVYSQGHFKSPMAALLPPESRYCQFVMVEPEIKKTAQNVYILLFPSTGEMGNGTRLGMAQRLAQQYGYSSIIPTAPFYGTRQPPTQFMFWIDSVTNMLLHSEGVIEEGLLLTEWILASKQNALVCHSGFSHGACTSAYTSVACLMMGLNGSRMASAPYSGFASPSVMADGCLESVLDWNALADKTTLDYETNRQHLYKLFQESQIELLASQVPDRPDNKLAVVRGMSFDRDGVIRPHYTRAMQEQLAPVAASNKVNVQWLPGGHTTAFLVRPICQQRLIEQTVQELLEANANANKGQPAVEATTTAALPARTKSD